jgi:hypothetical protein
MSEQPDPLVATLKKRRNEHLKAISDMEANPELPRAAMVIRSLHGLIEAMDGLISKLEADDAQRS